MNERQVIVIGAGPAGLSAAIESARRGADVLLVDENVTAGGQLTKQIHKFFGSSAHRAGVRGFSIGTQLVEEAQKYGVEIWLNSTVVGLFKGNQVAIDRILPSGKNTVVTLRGQIIVIATGAAENAVQFEGWTLPGVMTAGAVQTLINSQRVLPGKRVLMIGSGNVGLIVSYQLLQAGAQVAALVEAAPGIGGYSVHAGKIRRAGVPIYVRHTVLAARGDQRVEEATIVEVDDSWNRIPGTEKTLEVDTIAIAAGMTPLIRLARMNGCKTGFIPELGGWLPLHNAVMESSCPNVFVVGDAAGVEEASTAMEEGKLAGIVIANRLGRLNDGDYKMLLQETEKRLAGLRMGQFGEMRAEAKRRCVKLWEGGN